jgi:hypothetical protein
MGCLRRLGCLAVFAVLVVVGFLTRDMWLSELRRTPAPGSAEANLRTWQALTPAGASRAKKELERLQTSRGPVFVNIAAGDLAAYILQELSRTLPSSADSIEAAAIGDRLCVRAVVRISDLGDRKAMGPVAMLLGDRERLHLCGELRIIQPGFAELRVKELKIRELSLPQGLIPRLIRQISRGERPSGLSEDGLPLRTPDYIGDVRVQNGQITLYKNALRR